MTTALAEASQIAGVISGVIVVGAAGAACWKWNTIVQRVIRIAQDRPQGPDVRIVEEGLANNPVLQSTTTVARRGLEMARLGNAAQRLARVQQLAASHAPAQFQYHDDDALGTPSPDEQEEAARVRARRNRAEAQPTRVGERPPQPLGSPAAGPSNPSERTSSVDRPQGQGTRERRGLSSIKGGHTIRRRPAHRGDRGDQARLGNTRGGFESQR